MPCFSAGVVQTTNSLRQRFQLQLSADEAEQFVEADLVGKSFGSYYTRLYVSAFLPVFHTFGVRTQLTSLSLATTPFNTGPRVYTRQAEDRQLAAARLASMLTLLKIAGLWLLALGHRVAFGNHLGGVLWRVG
jgi:hypothetical protein